MGLICYIANFTNRVFCFGRPIALPLSTVLINDFKEIINSKEWGNWGELRVRFQDLRGEERVNSGIKFWDFVHQNLPLLRKLSDEQLNLFVECYRTFDDNDDVIIESFKDKTNKAVCVTEESGSGVAIEVGNKDKVVDTMESSIDSQDNIISVPEEDSQQGSTESVEDKGVDDTQVINSDDEDTNTSCDNNTDIVVNEIKTGDLDVVLKGENIEKVIDGVNKVCRHAENIDSTLYSISDNIEKASKSVDKLCKTVDKVVTDKDCKYDFDVVYESTHDFITKTYKKDNYIQNLLHDGVMNSNIVVVQGSTGSGKSMNSKAFAVGYGDCDGFASKGYYAEVNIDAAREDEDIFVTRELINSTTVRCKTPILALLDKLEENKEKIGVVEISDPRCDDLDKVLSKIKAVSGYTSIATVINGKSYTCLDRLYFIITINDRGSASINLSEAMLRRVQLIQCDVVDVPDFDWSSKFTDSIWGMYFTDGKSDFLRLLRLIGTVNKLIGKYYPFVEYVPYTPLQYRKEIIDSHYGVINLLMQFNNRIHELNKVMDGNQEIEDCSKFVTKLINKARGFIQQ